MDFSNSRTEINAYWEVTDVEVQRGLWAIADGKIPGVDGYNTWFFKKAWPIIKTDIMQVVKEFFYSGKMYRAVNCVAITVEPKIAGPVTIREFRPTACCTVLYRIICKIPDARLQSIIPIIIWDAQTGFVPRRKTARLQTLLS